MTFAKFFSLDKAGQAIVKLWKKYGIGAWKHKYDNEAYHIKNYMIQKERTVRNLGHIPYISIFAILFVGVNNHWFGEWTYDFQKYYYGTTDYNSQSVIGILSYPITYCSTWLAVKITNNPLTRSIGFGRNKYNEKVWTVGNGFRQLYRIPTYIILLCTNYFNITKRKINNHNVFECVDCQKLTSVDILKIKNLFNPNREKEDKDTDNSETKKLQLPLPPTN